MSELKIAGVDKEVVIEWFDDGEYVFDAVGLSNADVAALQLCHSTYESSSRDEKMRMRGMLRLIVELWNRSAEFNSEELLMWIAESRNN